MDIQDKALVLIWVIGMMDFGGGIKALSMGYFQNSDLLVTDSGWNSSAKKPGGDQVVVSVFGSATTDRFRPKSDFDQLVEIKPDKTQGIYGILYFDRGLFKLFRGLAVYLPADGNLSR